MYSSRVGAAIAMTISVSVRSAGSIVRTASNRVIPLDQGSLRDAYDSTMYSDHGQALRL